MKDKKVEIEQIDKKTALAAARIIKDYCRQQDCKTVYSVTAILSDEGRAVPAYWEIK